MVLPPDCTDPTSEGCACAAGSHPVDCYLDPAELPNGHLLCQVGTRTCRAGAWSACESITEYTLDLPKSLGTRSVCNACNPSCFEQTNSKTAGESSKCPTFASFPPIMPRISGISMAAMSRRHPGLIGSTAGPPKIAFPAVSRSNHAIAVLIASSVVS